METNAQSERHVAATVDDTQVPFFIATNSDGQTGPGMVDEA